MSHTYKGLLYRGIPLKKKTDRNRIILIHTIAHFCADCHDGQWSRGYRLLCRSLDWLKSQGIGHPLDIPLRPKGKKIYKYLDREYFHLV